MDDEQTAITLQNVGVADLTDLDGTEPTRSVRGAAAAHELALQGEHLDRFVRAMGAPTARLPGHADLQDSLTSDVLQADGLDVAVRQPGRSGHVEHAEPSQDEHERSRPQDLEPDPSALEQLGTMQEPAP
jgi:hypothetical protein